MSVVISILISLPFFAILLASVIVKLTGGVSLTKNLVFSCFILKTALYLSKIYVMLSRRRWQLR